MRASEKPAVRIPFRTAASWLRAAAVCQFDVVGIFQKEGLDVSGLHSGETTIERTALQRIFLRCIEQAQLAGSGQHFPLVLADFYSFEHLSDLEAFIMSCETLRGLSPVMAWLSALGDPDIHFLFGEHAGQARLIQTQDHEDAHPEQTWPSTEATFVLFVKFIRLLLGGRRLDARLTFRHQPHPGQAACQAFFQMPIEYGAEVDALWFEARLLDEPLRSGFPALNQKAAKQVAQRVAAIPDAASLVGKIETLLYADPDLLPQGLPALAAELGLAVRTVQRRLQEAGESHSAILGRVRLVMAERWLPDTNISIEEISRRLGFADRSSFTQAFTRWRGQTPSQFRNASKP